METKDIPDKLEAVLARFAAGPNRRRMMNQYIDAFFEDGVFRPREKVDLTSGSLVRLELKGAQQPRPQADLSEVEALYAKIDKKYPAANVRVVYRDRAELHDR